MGLIDEYSKQQEIVDASLDVKVNPTQLEWEPFKYHEFHNEFLTFDQSLERLRNAGYTRHPRPSEIFSQVCDYLEGKAEYRTDTYFGCGEWLSLAFEVKGNSLVCYTDPENLKYDGNRYVVDGPRLKYFDAQVFDISGIPLGTSVYLEKFNPEFIRAMYSRELSDLPEMILRGAIEEAQIKLRGDGIWPAGRDFDGWFSIYASYYCASLGVRKRG